jgi:hypothetical protein
MIVAVLVGEVKAHLQLYEPVREADGGQQDEYELGMEVHEVRDSGDYSEIAVQYVELDRAVSPRFNLRLELVGHDGSCPLFTLGVIG